MCHATMLLSCLGVPDSQNGERADFMWELARRYLHSHRHGKLRCTFVATIYDAILFGDFFLSVTDHLPLLAFSSHGFGTIL